MVKVHIRPISWIKCWKVGLSGPPYYFTVQAYPCTFITANASIYTPLFNYHYGSERAQKQVQMDMFSIINIFFSGSSFLENFGGFHRASTRYRSHSAEYTFETNIWTEDRSRMKQMLVWWRTVGFFVVAKLDKRELSCPVVEAGDRGDK